MLLSLLEKYPGSVGRAASALAESAADTGTRVGRRIESALSLRIADVYPIDGQQCRRTVASP
jgi:hypothetical protein